MKRALIMKRYAVFSHKSA